MSDIPTTPITVTYVFDDGRRVPMGTGTVDETGRIDITAPAAGQEDYIADAMAELNGRDFVILKLPPDDDMPQFSISKPRVFRDDPDFLPALKDYGMRVFSMEFDFDETAISDPPPEEDILETGDADDDGAPEEDDDGIALTSAELEYEPSAPE